MKKVILIFIFLFFLFQFIDVNALDFKCEVRSSCLSGQNAIFYMYNNVDSHAASIDSGVNWPKKLCCSSGLVQSCSGLNTQLFKIYLSNDGHVSVNNANYQKQVCLAVQGTVAGQGNVQCTLKQNCDTGEQCIITLSSTDDAHVSQCGVFGSYSNKLCCGVTVCPTDFTYIAGKCQPAFAACYVGDPTKLTSDEGVCKDKWRVPIKQSDPYWRDAVNTNNLDCFRFTNTQSCCPLTPTSVFDNKEYGKFSDVIVKKLTI